jgi:hypothetical protein
VLALPNGAQQQKLRNLDRIQTYVARHAASWYEYISKSDDLSGRGRGLANGDLYLVTGHEKTLSWGMASYSAAHKEFNLSFEVEVDQYHWGGVPRQINPSKRKYHNHLQEYDGPLNHTIFVHGLTISLVQGYWNRLFGAAAVETSSIEDSHLGRIASSQQSLSWWRLIFGESHNATGGRGSAGTMGGWGSSGTTGGWGSSGTAGGQQSGSTIRRNGEVVLSDFPPNSKVLPFLHH